MAKAELLGILPQQILCSVALYCGYYQQTKVICVALKINKMIRLTLIICFQIFMILFTVFIMNLALEQGNKELLFLGFGLPLWICLLYFYLRQINRINVETEFVTIKNIVFGQRDIYFKDIDHWEERYLVNLFAKGLLLKVKGKKIVILNMSDLKNYKILLDSLITKCIENNESKTSKY